MRFFVFLRNFIFLEIIFKVYKIIEKPKKKKKHKKHNPIIIPLRGNQPVKQLSLFLLCICVE